MAVVLDRVQRDAVYRFVVLDLPDMGDIALELNNGNLGAAQRLRRRFDENVLLLDLLDWGENGERESYEIAMPAEQAEAIFDRLYGRIMSDIEEAVSALLEHPVGEALAAARICTKVVRQLRSEASEAVKREARCLYEGQRRPDCG